VDPSKRWRAKAPGAKATRPPFTFTFTYLSIFFHLLSIDTYIYAYTDRYLDIIAEYAPQILPNAGERGCQVQQQLAQAHIHVSLYIDIWIYICIERYSDIIAKFPP